MMSIVYLEIILDNKCELMSSKFTKDNNVYLKRTTYQNNSNSVLQES
jgi:hypothetical protein